MKLAYNEDDNTYYVSSAWSSWWGGWDEDGSPRAEFLPAPIPPAPFQPWIAPNPTSFPLAGNEGSLQKEADEAGGLPP